MGTATVDAARLQADLDQLMDAMLDEHAAAAATLQAVNEAAAALIDLGQPVAAQSLLGGTHGLVDAVDATHLVIMRLTE